MKNIKTKNINIAVLAQAIAILAQAVAILAQEHPLLFRPKLLLLTSFEFFVMSALRGDLDGPEAQISLISATPIV